MTSEKQNIPELKVIVNPLDRVLIARKGDILLNILRESGIRIESLCGGKGSCGKCRVILESGKVEEIGSKLEDHLTIEERNMGYSLACSIKLQGDTVFTIPSESRIQNPNILVSNLYSEQKKSLIPPNMRRLGLAIDVGTTTIVGQLIDRDHQSLISSTSTLNRQITYGEGLLTRINYAKTPDGLSRIQRAVVDSINEVINNLIEKSEAPIENISYVSIGGNPVMLYLLNGINPVPLEDPYAKVSRKPIRRKAGELGFNVPPTAQVYCLPNVSRFVGGDAVGDIISSGLYKSDQVSLLIDLGTNGEIIVGNKNWLISTSCASGPAFEGEGIRHGMRASKGSIDHIEVNKDTHIAKYSVIGGTKPKGLCGSGIIDLVYELHQTGLMDFVGKFIASSSQFIREGKWGLEYLVVAMEDSDIGRDIVLTQADLDYFMDSKAAVCGSVTVLMNKMHLKVNDIRHVYLAGAFSNFSKIDNVTKVGIIPEFPNADYHYIGNGSLSGAYLTLISNEKKVEAEEIAEKMVYFDLLLDSSFMDEYSKALYIPGAREYFPGSY